LVQCTSFQGPFDLRGASAVVRLDPWPNAPPLQDVLLRLVEHSWLRVDPRRFGQFFSFYAGQREFLAEEAAPDLLAASAARHVAFHAALAAAQDIEQCYLVGGPDWERLQTRGVDLKAAFRAAEGRDLVGLAVTLGRVLLSDGPLEECLAVVRRGLASFDTEACAPAGQRLALLHYQAVALRHLGRADQARALLLPALAEPALPEPGPSRGRLLRALGVLEMNHGDPATARRHLEEAHQAHKAAGVPLDEAVSLAESGTLAFLQGDTTLATTRIERALGPLRAAGAGWVYAVYLVNLGVVELVAGQLDSAARHLTEALELHRRAGGARFEALALGNLALVEEQRGAYAVAHRHLDDAFELTRRTGDQGEEGSLWSSRGLVLLSQGEVDAASQALERADALAYALPNPRLQAEVASRRARVLLSRGEVEQAGRLLDVAEETASRLNLRTELADIRRVRADVERRRGSPGEER
jgi:tetratricopeptide (TPR) repeat protein